MKLQLIITVGAAVVAGLAPLRSYSESAWFDAGIKDYTEFPPTACPGEWQNTDVADLVGEPGAKSLLVSPVPTSGLAFVADGAKRVGTNVVTVSTSVKLTVYPSADKLPTLGSGTRGGFAAVQSGEAVVCFGVAKDPVGGTNTWVALQGTVAVTDEPVDLIFDFKKEDGVKKVRYTVGETVLTSAGDEWIEFVSASASAKVSTVTYDGKGEVMSLVGQTAFPILPVTLTIPSAEHMTVASVTVNGEPVMPVDGVYSVPQDSVVTVRFEPEEGWVISKPTIEIQVADENIVVAESELPKAFDLTLRINEVMASNGESLQTANGTLGIDWIELYNAGDVDVDLSNWYLGNDPTKKTGKWAEGFAIQGSCVVPAKGYKIVWFDGDGLCESWDENEAHVACNISTTAGKHTLFLASEADKTKIVCELPLPAQIKDVSYGFDANNEWSYFRTPTPGAENTEHGYGPVTPKVTFSEPHGYKTAPFELTLACPDAQEATIRYTLDGTSPTTASPEYTGAISVSKTTCIRAAVIQDNAVLQLDTSATYLYLDDILAQNENARPSWFPDTTVVNDQYIAYGLNQGMVTGADRQRILNGFSNSIATVSLVLDPRNLFDKDTGIYVNAKQSGREWERQTMVEQIDPVNGASNEFSVAAGIRIRGAASRNANYWKHSFRLFFRSEYGYSSLNHRLFGDEGADNFDKIDFRTSQNAAWHHGDRNDTFIHECFSRDSQRDMDEPYNRSRYYNLFINGVYWGLYQTEERVDQTYSENYNGGLAQDYDVMRTKHEDYQTAADEGTDAAWRGIWGIVTKNGTKMPDCSETYNLLRGLDENGVRDPSLPVYLNAENLIKMIMTVHFTGDNDSPANESDKPNNILAFRNRRDQGLKTGFLWNRHDAERSLNHDGSPAYDLCTSLMYGVNQVSYPFFNPSALHGGLIKNAEYKMLFADLVNKHIVRPDGELSPAKGEARYRARMAEIDDAIACEAARWGRNLGSHAQWLENCAHDIEFINRRMPYLIAGYRNLGWYPSIDAPMATNSVGGLIADGTQFGAGEFVYLSGGHQGTVYYTTDGSDPRLVGGEFNPNALAYSAPLAVPDAGLKLTMRVRSAQGEWSAIDSVSVQGSVAQVSPAEALRVAAVMSSAPGSDADDFLVLTNLSDSAISLAGVKLVAWNQKKKSESDPSLVLIFDASRTIAAGGSLTLTAADFGDGKLTNSDVGIRLYDISGAEPVLFQDVFVSADWFGGVCDGKGQYFVAKEFGATVTDITQWRSSDSPDEPVVPYVELEGDGYLFYLHGEYTDPVQISPTGSSCKVIFDGASVPGLKLVGAVDCAVFASNENQVASLTASAASVAIEGDGALRLEGADTLAIVSNLFVRSGTFAVRSTGVSATKTPVVNVLGSVEQTGGMIDIDLDVATTNQIYGIYVANKDMKAKFSGGTLNAKVGGTKSAAIYGNKGSVNPVFSGEVAVTASLTGPEARFVNAEGNVKLKGGTFDVTMPESCTSLTNARVFKATKDIEISGGTFSVKVPAPGSEIFSTDKTIVVSDGVLSLEAADDCFSATGDIEITNGVVHATSIAGDAIDSNGSITILGGKVFAFTLSAEHDAIDVDPAQDEPDAEHNIIILDGATVVAVGGNVDSFHEPDEGSTARFYAEDDLTSVKEYIELTGVLAGANATTTTVLSVSWNGRHAKKFTLIAAMPGYDGTAYVETDDKPAEAQLLHEAVPGVFVLETVEATGDADWPEDPDVEITDDTTPADLAITAGAFAEATTDELRKLSRWAKANEVPYGGTAVNSMVFDADGNPATVFEEAYLLNCAPTVESVAAAKALFKFNTIVPGVQPVIEGEFNGRVTVLGSESLGPDLEWIPNNPAAHFYKAVLTR